MKKLVKESLNEFAATRVSKYTVERAVELVELMLEEFGFGPNDMSYDPDPYWYICQGEIHDGYEEMFELARELCGATGSFELSNAAFKKAMKPMRFPELSIEWNEDSESYDAVFYYDTKNM